jgi:2-polyprenyl-3-methyl-5-hydroxy-6-metoxy-1,4-benzoquinol methylase
LLESRFVGIEKDFSSYSGIIKEISQYLGRKLTILDYGANWGYACFQFGHFDEVEDVYGLELSQPRREFGEANLGVKYINNPSELDASVDLVFSSHVIEHMSNPSMIKECADKVLKSDGVILLTCPNGSDSAHFLRHHGEGFGAKSIPISYLISISVAFFLILMEQFLELKYL